MTITAALCALSLQVILDDNGLPIPGATLSVYDAGTTTARPTYADAGMTSDQPWPVVADAYGRLPAMFVGAGAYRMVLADAAGGQIAAVDGVPGGTEADAVTTIPAPVPTAFIAFSYTATQRDGWLPLDGRTIGNPTSGATARANADVQSLYVELWNGDPTLTVLGGRGTTATADFNASKTIQLPTHGGRQTIATTNPDGSAGIIQGYFNIKI